MMSFRFLALAAFTVLTVGANPLMYKDSGLQEQLPITKAEYCCIDHPNKPTTPPQSTYDCSQLTALGKERCVSVFGGSTCTWAAGDDCNSGPKECTRVSHIEIHNNMKIDVGRCDGPCEDGKCKPSKYDRKQFEDADGNVKEVLIIAACECSGCAAEEAHTSVEIPVGKCSGRCPSQQESRTCLAGVFDQYSTANGAETATPSPALQAGWLQACSAGWTSSFDNFADNVCFGHTFSTGCFQQGKCPLKGAKLRFCTKASRFALTHTDSIMLGIGGSGLWGMRMTTLNGGTWNRHEELCMTLDLDNLPPNGAGVTSILSDIEAAGHLDFGMQDDSAVDGLALSLEYEDCLVCRPSVSTISSLYTPRGVKDFENIEDCDCIDGSECQRAKHIKTYFPGTIFETTVDVGQCVGRCPRLSRCTPKEYTDMGIKAPEGKRGVRVIKSCACQKFVFGSIDIIKPL